MFKIATVTDARILEITREYVENKKSLDEIAKENKIGRATVKKYIQYSQDIDEKLYNRAMLRLGRYKSSKKKKGMKLTLDVFDSIGTKKISKKDLKEWWIKNVEVNDLPIVEIVKLAKLAGIEVVGG
ncbi:MAG: hypothetical protein K0S61_732 [Anaerocolumna sp.]|nr:hypothetical protein [Anaerocolumna sp.]